MKIYYETGNMYFSSFNNDGTFVEMLQTLSL